MSYLIEPTYTALMSGLIIFGLVYIIVDSLIMSPVRIRLSLLGGFWLESLVHCPYCVAYWVGCALSLTAFGPLKDFTWGPGFLGSLVEASFSGAWATGLVLILSKLVPLGTSAEDEGALVSELRQLEKDDKEP